MFSIRSRMWTPGRGTWGRCWNDTMATWILLLRRTMRVRAPWTATAESLRSARRGTMFKRFRMPISGPAPDAWTVHGAPPAPFVNRRTRRDAPSSPTTDSFPAIFKLFRPPIRGSVVACFAAASLICASSLCAAPAQKSSAKLQAAQTQFSRAEEARAGLNSKPAAERTLADYKKTLALYRRVALTTPRAPEVPEAFLAIGELNSEMGDRFGRAYFQSAVDAYQFLVHEYPASRRRQEALLRIAQLQKDRLGDSALATKTYEEFLKLYPRSTHR